MDIKTLRHSAAHVMAYAVTQLWPDAMNHWGFPSPVLRRGEKLHSLTSYRFSVNK